ncbi:carbamoyltransferase HypF [Azospirillum brasilense]|uniref:carbamoyltransferase HypF n=1 Tax=Azospirillum brasilense TaxID=192 RepID=UPI000E68A716|nr:carbamoyltransferase HypF [Azospirillum brasilense]NUB25122.1 carbamoyltransferase HypF [Azospirillum brasilense]NUB31375.1 carbamoyltransferase HypF [Azospirillum brasilense]RIW07645.1 carbamoyltransferase HypF [Azospirillum brasilense]
MKRLRLRVRGQVQGVGFRPFLHGLAHRLALTGWVLNDGAGVLAEVQGDALERFLTALAEDAPPLARIDAVEAEDCPIRRDEAGFAILASHHGAVTTGVAPDAAICPACVAELFDPADRRYRYPFLNCTHCGPRFTITRALPYDRPQTAMAGFPLCPDCSAEYADPTDRRFHAQPTACPACGPRLSHSIAEVLAALRGGRIVAIKGLGGFHLACDAFNAAAVERLRARKQRNGKPFALMVANIASTERFVEVGAAERALLEGVVRPVVLLRRRDGATTLPDSIAPGLAWLGVMLPYTPIHHLLFHEAAGRPDGTAWLERPQNLTLVMTSANPGGEPLAIDNDEARQRLHGFADLIVDHDRDILIRADDSVMRVVAGAPALLRRGRGHAPAPIRLPRSGPSVLAVGGHLKATVCLTRGNEAFLSQHIGDLDNAATLGFLEESVAHLRRILAVEPVAVAHDLHPDFQSTRFAESLGLPTLPVQHHHAHIAAVLAEHGVDGPALGLALDGFGLGADGGSWGGEMLLLKGAGFTRLGHLAPLAQPGGDVAARQPWRMAAAALARMGRGAEITGRFAACGPADGVRRMIEGGINAPPTSSCGRWFDAACGLLGVRAVAGFEGEAPMALESLVRRPTVLKGGWRIEGGVLDLTPLLENLLQINAQEGADRFHGTLAAALVAWAMPELAARGLDHVALSGGCLMNAVLAEELSAGFAARGVTALLPRQAPANDGGLSLGQAWVAMQSLLEEGPPPCASPFPPA